MKVTATVCSREKSPDSEPLPAKERYLGEHIKTAKAWADKSGTPFYILSGKYGLISGDELISNYDHLLEKESEELLTTVIGQAQDAGITEVDFYCKDKSNWVPYSETLQKACKFSSIILRIHKI